MTISELQEELEEFKKEHGDMEVVKMMDSCIQAPDSPSKYGTCDGIVCAI